MFWIRAKPPSISSTMINKSTYILLSFIFVIQQSYTDTSREIPGSTYELCELIRKVGPRQTSANPIPWQGTPKLVPWRVHDPYPPPSGGVLTQAADWTVAARKLRREGFFSWEGNGGKWKAASLPPSGAAAMMRELKDSSSWSHTGNAMQNIFEKKQHSYW